VFDTHDFELRWKINLFSNDKSIENNKISQRLSYFAISLDSEIMAYIGR